MFDIAISYFYQVRNFKPYMLPISTAVWDPKWYHAFKQPEHTFVDKNGVMNGLRIKPLAPNSSCSNLCRGPENCNSIEPGSCEFLQKYREQLDKINFDEFMFNLDLSGRKLKHILNFEETPMFVLLVHEKYDNPCSERSALISWFRDNGKDLKELQYPVKDFY